MNNEGLMATYDVMVQAICDTYLGLYRKDYPDKLTFDTAKVFMDNNYEFYRKEIATLGISTMHKLGIGSDMAKEILNKNGFSISKLYLEIMKISMQD